MSKSKIVHLVIGLSVVAFLTAGVAGIVSAAVVSPKVSSVGSSNSRGLVRRKMFINKAVYKQERLSAEAKVLNTSTANISSAIKDKSLVKLIEQSGMTRKEFKKKVDSDFVSALESMGYSKDQVIISMQHRQIVHLRKELKKK